MKLSINIIVLIATCCLAFDVAARDVEEVIEWDGQAIALHADQGITALVNTMMGELKIENGLSLEVIGKTNDNLQTLSSRNRLLHINGGGAEASIVTISGDITFTKAQ